MTPRENSTPWKALEYIRLHGSARSRELAQHCGVSTSTMSALMTPYADDLTLVVCKVDVPGEPQQNEYRISAIGGGKLAAQTINQRNAQHRAAVATENSPALAPVPGVRHVSPSAERARQHAESSPPDATRKQAGLRATRFHSALHGDGRLVLELNGETMVLAPVFTEEVARLLSGRAYEGKGVAA